MPYTPVRDIELIDTGSLGKEVLSNDAFTNLAHGISGAATIPLAATDHTLTLGTTGKRRRLSSSSRARSPPTSTSLSLPRAAST